MHLLALVVTFVTGFALCYALMSNSSDMPRRLARKNQVARLTFERSTVPPLVTTHNAVQEQSMPKQVGIRRVETHVFIPNGKTAGMPLIK